MLPPVVTAVTARLVNRFGDAPFAARMNALVYGLGNIIPA
jgi:hypothetical protein